MWCIPKTQLNRIESEQAEIKRRFESIEAFLRVHLKLVVDLEGKMVDFGPLQAEVARNSAEVQKAVARIQELYGALAAAVQMGESGVNEAEVMAAVADVEAKLKTATDALAAAVAATAPVESPVEPEMALEAPVEVPAEAPAPVEAPVEPAPEQPVA